MIATVATLTAWPATATMPQMRITIESFSPYFLPAAASVSSGTSILWENPTPTHHTVTHNGCVEEGHACAFESGTITPGGTYTLPGLPPGRYPYHCRVHPIMQGILVVVDGPPFSSET